MSKHTNNPAIEDIVRIINGNVFFVVGAARSGTTWLQFCLDGHPDVSCKGEGHFVDALLPRLRHASVQYNKEVMSRSNISVGDPSAFLPFASSDLQVLLSCAIGMLLMKNAHGKSCKWLGEKTPDNILDMQLLADMFPRSRFIHLIRDGRDAAVSAWFNNLRISERHTREQYGDFRGHAKIYAEAWARKVKVATAFGERNRSRYFCLFYEDLHRNFEETLRGVLEFLDVNTRDDVIELCWKAGDFSRHTGNRKRGTDDRKSHFRKGVIGDWVNHFDDASLETFMEQAGSVLEELGYV